MSDGPQPESWPRVSVIVLNYNGSRLLPACLRSLAATDYPPGFLEPIVVDNASVDGSAEMIAREFRWARVIALPRNLGFAGGNNVGIEASDAPYVVLLNNDTAVDPAWLKPLVRAAEADAGVGACGSKIVFFYDTLPVVLEVEGTFVPAEALGTSDRRVLGVRLVEARLRDAVPGAEVGYGAGWYPPEASGERTFRWSSGKAVLNLPVGDRASPVDLSLSFEGGPPEPLAPARVRIRIAATEVAILEVGSGPQTLSLRVPIELLASAERRVQNAGQELLPGGYCRDRGSWVEGGVELHAPDGAYERGEEVFALCGAAVLLRRAMLDEVGLLDERFFMYYEDIDLCWRARLAGWRMMYVADSMVRHVHCASSGEWTPFFRFHVERNRLLVVLKNAPARFALRALLDWVREALRRTNRAVWRENVRIGLSLVAGLSRVLRERRRIRARAVVEDRAILSWTVR